MTTIMSTMWIAGIAAVLLLGAVAWGLSRRRHADRAAAIAPVPAAPAPIATPDAAGREQAGLAASAKAETSGTGPPGAGMDTEFEVLRRLCALAFADGAVPEPGAAPRAAQAEAAAIAVLARIDAHPRYTPRRPQLLPQLTRTINDPSASAHTIAGILARDPALAGNLLRIANSAFYRRHPEPIESLQRAVALLGTEGLRQIVLAALLQPVVADDGSTFGRCAAILWDHTVLSAKVATRTEEGAAPDDALQLLALVYGLGSVAVVQVLRDAWARCGETGPGPDTMAGMLATWSAPCARAISADWGLSARVQQALAELAGDAGAPPMGELGRLLRTSRAIAGTELQAMTSDSCSQSGQVHAASSSPA